MMRASALLIGLSLCFSACSSANDGALVTDEQSADAGVSGAGVGVDAAGTKGTGGARDGGRGGASGAGGASGTKGTGGAQHTGGNEDSGATGGSTAAGGSGGSAGAASDAAARGRCDQGSWSIANLPAPGTPGIDYVSDLAELPGAWNGLGQIGKDLGNNSVGPLVINGVCYPKGLGMRAYAGIKYDLGGKYRRFVSDTGLDDVANSNTVIFHVIVDGNYLADYEIHAKSDTKALDIDVTGMNVMEIGVRDCWDTVDDDFSVWGGARLLK